MLGGADALRCEAVVEPRAQFFALMGSGHPRCGRHCASSLVMLSHDQASMRYLWHLCALDGATSAVLMVRVLPLRESAEGSFIAHVEVPLIYSPVLGSVAIMGRGVRLWPPRHSWHWIGARHCLVAPEDSADTPVSYLMDMEMHPIIDKEHGEAAAGVALAGCRYPSTNGKWLLWCRGESNETVCAVNLLRAGTRPTIAEYSPAISAECVLRITLAENVGYSCECGVIDEAVVVAVKMGALGYTRFTVVDLAKSFCGESETPHVVDSIQVNSMLLCGSAVVMAKRDGTRVIIAEMLKYGAETDEIYWIRGSGDLVAITSGGCICLHKVNESLFCIFKINTHEVWDVNNPTNPSIGVCKAVIESVAVGGYSHGKFQCCGTLIYLFEESKVSVADMLTGSVLLKLWFMNTFATFTISGIGIPTCVIVPNLFFSSNRFPSTTLVFLGSCKTSHLWFIAQGPSTRLSGPQLTPRGGFLFPEEEALNVSLLRTQSDSLE
ncbi:hypothetical protein Pelo_17312 [Pelomyxa schiedti]|nr:hypothetical protein Pelo_17312 [Pelomyxa schiedti]